MASRPVQISLDQDLLRRIAAEPEARRHGRSAFIRSAVQLYLKAKERHDIDRAIRRAYSGKAELRSSEWSDHQWFLEAGEELPTHKENPKMVAIPREAGPTPTP